MESMIYRVSYKSMETNNYGSIDVEAVDRSDAICGVLRKYPQLIVLSADIFTCPKIAHRP